MMKRVVKTSAGYLAIEFTGRDWTTAEAHDSDGWRTASCPFQLSENGAAQRAVAEATKLPSDEVEQIVAETLAQYELRGGEGAAKDRIFGRRRNRPT